MARTTLILALAALAILACAPTSPPPLSRLDAIPTAAVKGHPDGDPWPPVVTPGWSQPQPLGAPINTAGAEDSPFITPYGQTFYFFFTLQISGCSKIRRGVKQNKRMNKTRKTLFGIDPFISCSLSNV